MFPIADNPGENTYEAKNFFGYIGRYPYPPSF